MYSTTKLLVMLVLVGIFSGCATNRGIIELNEEVSSNPETGTAIKFVRVSDKRVFQVSPPQANIPSLKYDEDINKPEIKSRAIARKRNAYGKALGDILLPEGKTIMGLVESNLSKGLRQSGYRVVSKEDQDFKEATPVEVDIDKFWGWFSPGFWSIGINFETSIVVTAPAGDFKDGMEFDSKVQKRFQTAAEGNWLETINAAMDVLYKDIASEIDKQKKKND